MALKSRILSRRKLTASIAAGVAAIALATGGYAVANSGSSSSANTATAGKVIPFARGNPSPATPVGQIPANFTDGSGTIVTGTAANKAKAARPKVHPPIRTGISGAPGATERSRTDAGERLPERRGFWRL